MASKFWCWLTDNSAPLQSLTSMLAVVVAGVVGWVSWKQKRAADAQALAAKEQTAAAKEQTAAAKEQVVASVQQTKTAILIADRQTSAHLSITQSVRQDGSVVPESITILNNGHGLASNIALKYRDGTPGSELFEEKELVVGDSMSVHIDEGRSSKSGLLLTYTTMFGTNHAPEFDWNGRTAEPQKQRLSLLPSQNQV